MRRAPTVRPALFGAVLLAGLAAAGCGGRERSTIQFRVPVRTAVVETGTVEDRILATGSLRPRELVALRTETSGRIEVARDRSGRRLGEGDRVEAGQRVGAITGEDVDVAARLDATRRRLEAARVDLESKRRLLEAGLITAIELKQAETAFSEAEAEWRRSRLTVERAVIRTPISGVILRLCRDDQGRCYADGQLVGAGFLFAEIAPDDELVADIDLLGGDVERVAIGQEVRVRSVSLPDATFAGEVVRIGPSLDPATRALRVEVAVRNEGRKLKPGMFVEATIVVARHSGVPVVPREAVVWRSGKRVLFVVKGQRAVRREVEVGLGDDEVVEIVDGVAPGESIVIRGLETLSDGSLVRVGGA